jgi:23S rRNA pseudouridine2605 synthase
VASRRAADELIASGEVLVNGRRPPATGLLIDPANDLVTISGRAIRPVTRHRYILLNKPLGVMTTSRDDEGRQTVLDAIGPEGLGTHRLYPVGRLDADTTGLLLLTDDGQLAYRLTHPRFKVGKEYSAVVSGTPNEKDLTVLRSGVLLEDGVTAPAEAEVVRTAPGPKSEVRLVIHEGRKRQVRRMLEASGHPVLALKRIGFGPLKLGRLKEGGWRLLAEGELAALRRATGLRP